ncbi:MAG: hypothetical protein J6X80_00265 [Lachnospiraceae bacterium]|nr:hypothetical protein [Lachnospiraceae bacterium]
MIKKKILYILGAFTLVASLTACSLLPSKGNEGNNAQAQIEADPGKEAAKPEVEIQPDNKVTPAEPEEEPTQTSSTADYKNLEEYFSNPLNKAALEIMSNSPEYENIFSNVEVTVEGNRMIYKFTSVNELGSNIEETMQANANAAKGQLFANIRSMVDTEEKMEIEYIYFNPDGTQVADIVMYEEDGDQTGGYESAAEEGTLQHYYETTFGPDYWNNSIDAMLAQYGETVTDIEIECIGNTLASYYYLAANIGDQQEAMEASYDDATKKSLIDQVKVPAGVKDTVTIEYHYINPDGSVAAEIIFSE